MQVGRFLRRTSPRWTAGAGLSATLSGGQAQAVLARTPALSPVVHRAFASGLDLAYVVAAGLGLLAAAAEPAPASVEG
jgi:hypothetical protein